MATACCLPQHATEEPFAALDDGTLNFNSANSIGITPGDLAIVSALKELAGGGGGAVQTVTSSAVTAGGTVAAGARSVMFIFAPDFVGTVDGVAYNFANDSSISLSAQDNDTLEAIAYTRSAGTLRIVETR